MFGKSLIKFSSRICAMNKIKFGFTRKTSPFKINPNNNYYEWLQVGKDASTQQIQQSYNRLAKQAQNHQKYQRLNQINEAYKVLSDQSLRNQYNKLRFIAEFDKKMNQHFDFKSNSSQKVTNDNKYSDLTPEEQQIGQRIAKKVKIFIMITIALSIFGPFIFWKGNSNNQSNNIDQTNYYPKRHGGGYLNRNGHRDQNQAGSQLYQQQINAKNIRSMNPQGYVITGQIVED